MSRSFTNQDVQKIRVEKLMQNIDKPIEIPERRPEKKFPDAPDFVRNIMGSSAGAGSGEFHVYRHLRRKEFARQKHIELQAKHEEKEENFRIKVETNKRLAEERTAKKRAKRLKKKEKMKNKRKKGNSQNAGEEKKKESQSQSQSEKSGDDEGKDEEEEKKKLSEGNESEEKEC